MKWFWERQERKWREQEDRSRALRRDQWVRGGDDRIEQLAKRERTPINDVFAEGRGVQDVASYIAALERRVARLEKSVWTEE